jgi:hypothetical protein
MPYAYVHTFFNEKTPSPESSLTELSFMSMAVGRSNACSSKTTFLLQVFFASSGLESFQFSSLNPSSKLPSLFSFSSFQYL